MGAVETHADVLDFNSLQIGEEVRGYYDGGFGSLGTGPGPSFGITFTNDFATVAEGVFGPPFRAEELTSGSGTMDVAAGFSGNFSFYYKNSGAAGSVNLYSDVEAAAVWLEHSCSQQCPASARRVCSRACRSNPQFSLEARTRWSSTTSLLAVYLTFALPNAELR
jgi:hypothetical protein